MTKLKVNENFIIKLQGKEYVTYEGLLDTAHQMGLKSMEVEIIQMPSAENNMTAICIAIATTEDGTYQDIGDASPKSVNNMLAPHIIRMASTRAKARALRDLTNIGITALEELDIDSQYSGNKKLKKSNSSNNTITEKQLDRLYKIAYSKGITREIVNEQVKKKLNKDPKELTREEYDGVCMGYEKIEGGK